MLTKMVAQGRSEEAKNRFPQRRKEIRNGFDLCYLTTLREPFSSQRCCNASQLTSYVRLPENTFAHSFANMLSGSSFQVTTRRNRCVDRRSRSLCRTGGWFFHAGRKMAL